MQLTKLKYILDIVKVRINTRVNPITDGVRQT